MLVVPAIGWLWLVSLVLLGLAGFQVRRHHFEAAGIAFGVGCALFVTFHVRALRLSPIVLGFREASAIAAIPAAVALVAFAWSIGLGPLSDDFVLLSWATAGDWATADWAYFRPLPLALWQVAVAAGGVAALHALNVCVHAINSALVATLAAGWLGSRAGIAAGVLFALFPASTEAVAWAAGVFDLLSTLFVLLAAVIWTRWPPTTGRTVALVICCLAGLLSKESAVVIPALLGLIIVLTPVDSRLELRRQILAWAALSITMCGLVAAKALASPAVVAHLANLPGDRRAWKDMIIRPFASAAVPVRTESGVGVDGYLLGLGVLAAVAVIVIRGSRNDLSSGAPPATSNRLAVLSLGAAWIAISAAPLLGQFHVSPVLEGGRYLYLPAVGFAILLASSAAGSTRDIGLPALALTMVLLVYSVTLTGERSVWQDAARTRDDVLAQTEATTRTTPCRTIRIVDAPDNVRGAFVFREGLSEAIAAMPYDPGGSDCTLRWNGSALVATAP